MKLKYVDALRGLAILGVFIVHCSQCGNREYFPPGLIRFFDAGAMGVELFFIVSAFTLFLSMSKRHQHEKSLITAFFIRRFFRIAPMYYIGICYYLCQNGTGPRYWLGNASGISAGNILSNVFFVHGLNPYWINSLVPGGWSIAVEMFFYCLAPLLFLKIKNMEQAYLLILIALIINFILSQLLHQFPLINDNRLWDQYLFFYFPNQFPIFALGILFYFVVKENYKVSISPTIILLFSLIFIGQLAGLKIIPDHFLFGLLFIVLAIVLSKYDFTILVNPIFIYLGKISYSMYLVHFTVLHWFIKFNFINYIPVTNLYTGLLNFAIRLLLLIMSSAIISSFFYKCIELPFQKMGKRLIDKLTKYTIQHS